jgi:hypothetical protein
VHRVERRPLFCPRKKNFPVAERQKSFFLCAISSLCASVVGLLLLPVSARADWAEDTLAKMSREEKIGSFSSCRPVSCGRRSSRRSIKGYPEVSHWRSDSETGTPPATRPYPEASKSYADPIALRRRCRMGTEHAPSDTIVYPQNQTLGKIRDLLLFMIWVTKLADSANAWDFM